MIDNIVQWSPGVSLDNIERQVILAAFRHYRGNKTATANSLGIAIRTLDNKLEKYQKDDDDQKEKDRAELNNREQFLKRQRGEANTWQPPIKPSSAKDTQRAAANGEDTEAGLSMEPVVATAAKLEVPVHERKEVQSVSSKRTATSGKRKRR